MNKLLSKLERWSGQNLRRWRTLLFVAFVAVVLAVTVSTKGLQDCIREYDEHHSDEHHHGLIFLGARATFCTIRVFDRHNGALVALFTFTLWITTQGTLAHMRRDFLATHRPKLVLRRITFAAQDPPGADGKPAPPVIQIEVANVGESDAIIEHFHLAFPFFHADKFEPWKVLEKLETPPVEHTPVRAGGSVLFKHPFNALDAALFYSRAVQREKATIYCAGYFHYLDLREQIVRRTGFIRRCNAAKRWFEPVEMPDFNYTD